MGWASPWALAGTADVGAMTRPHLSDFNTLALAALPAWWERIDDNPKWQEYSFVGLSVGEPQRQHRP